MQRGWVILLGLVIVLDGSAIAGAEESIPPAPPKQGSALFEADGTQAEIIKKGIEKRLNVYPNTLRITGYTEAPTSDIDNSEEFQRIREIRFDFQYKPAGADKAIRVAYTCQATVLPTADDFLISDCTNTAGNKPFASVFAQPLADNETPSVLIKPYSRETSRDKEGSVLKTKKSPTAR